MGERSATFEAFYAWHYAPVCRGLTLALHDPQLAEEAAQEAFIRAYVSWRRVERMESPAGWVYVVAVRVASRRRRTAASPRTEARADELAESVVVRESVREAIDQLPERQRLAVVLRYFGDLSLAEIAAAMGCAVGTVKSTLHSALARLEVELDDDSEEVHDAS